MAKQVDRSHYAFESYESEARFTSYYHQVRSVLSLQPRTLLEIGGGSAAFASLVRGLGIYTYSLDVDPALQPTIRGDVSCLPITSNSVDICVAFQVLEHLPFEKFSSVVCELSRVSRIGAVISLPEFGNAGVVLTVPFVRRIHMAFRAVPPFYAHHFDGEHYWEINKRGYPLSKIFSGISDAGLTCERTWLNPYNPYHRFFVCRKK
jgi:hypothetical protein